LPAISLLDINWRPPSRPYS